MEVLCLRHCYRRWGRLSHCLKAVSLLQVLGEVGSSGILLSRRKSSSHTVVGESGAGESPGQFPGQQVHAPPIP